MKRSLGMVILACAVGALVFLLLVNGNPPVAQQNQGVSSDGTGVEDGKTPAPGISKFEPTPAPPEPTDNVGDDGNGTDCTSTAAVVQLGAIGIPLFFGLVFIQRRIFA